MEITTPQVPSMPCTATSTISESADLALIQAAYLATVATALPLALEVLHVPLVS